VCDSIHRLCVTGIWLGHRPSSLERILYRLLFTPPLSSRHPILQSSTPSQRQAHQQAPKAKELPSRICYNCRQPRHYANECPNSTRNKPHPQGKAPKQIRVIIISQIIKWSKVSVTSWVLFLLENTSLCDLPSFVVCEQPTVDFWW
jgi:hypothetical protein